MTAGEDHSELIVFDFLLEKELMKIPAMKEDLFCDASLLRPEILFAPENVEGSVFGHLHDPARRILRDAMIGPLLESVHKRILDDVFRQAQPVDSEEACQYCDEATRLMAE
jgi:hypothetical protein